MSPPEVNKPEPQQEAVDLTSVVDELLARIDQTAQQLTDTIEKGEDQGLAAPVARASDPAPAPVSGDSVDRAAHSDAAQSDTEPSAMRAPDDAISAGPLPEAAAPIAQASREAGEAPTSPPITTDAASSDDLGASLDALLDNIQVAADGVEAAAQGTKAESPAAALAESKPDSDPSASSEPGEIKAEAPPSSVPEASDGVEDSKALAAGAGASPVDSSEHPPDGAATTPMERVPEVKAEAFAAEAIPAASPVEEAPATASSPAPPSGGAPSTIESLDEQLAKLTDDLLSDATGEAPKIPPPESATVASPPPSPTKPESVAPPAASPAPAPAPAPVPSSPASTKPEPIKAPDASKASAPPTDVPVVEARPPFAARVATKLAPVSQATAKALAGPLTSRPPEQQKAAKLIAGWTTAVALVFWCVVLFRPRSPEAAHAAFDLEHGTLPDVPNAPEEHGATAHGEVDHGGGHGEAKKDDAHGGAKKEEGHGAGDKKKEKPKAPKPPTRSAAKKKDAKSGGHGEAKKGDGHGGGH